jgi:iron(III) transport system ATP-binding protein
MISVRGLTKTFGTGAEAFRAINGIDFDVPQGAVLTLLGPSGCGKTTTLRCLAGLERPDNGSISIGGKAVVDTRERVFVPIHKRKIGMVFQSYAIWPHMTVLGNVCYPLGERGMGRREMRERGEAALALVGLEGLGGRLAPNLSGGQQQRVALARAIVAEPEVLLLDEPLSNLDAKLRESMRVELRSLQQRLGITTVYVTHDQIEALSMSDVVVVMNRGVIVEQGAPRELYERPRTQFVADFLGTANFVTSCPHGCPAPLPSADGEPGWRSIRPEDITLSQAQADADRMWRGKVVKALFLGSHTYCEVTVNTHLLKVNVHRAQNIQTGDDVYVGWDQRYCAREGHAGNHLDATQTEVGPQLATSGISRAERPDTSARAVN